MDRDRIPPLDTPGRAAASYRSALYDRARAAGIVGRSGLSDAQLAALLREG